MNSLIWRANDLSTKSLVEMVLDLLLLVICGLTLELLTTICGVFFASLRVTLVASVDTKLLVLDFDGDTVVTGLRKLVSDGWTSDAGLDVRIWPEVVSWPFNALTLTVISKVDGRVVVVGCGCSLLLDSLSIVDVVVVVVGMLLFSLEFRVCS